MRTIAIANFYCKAIDMMLINARNYCFKALHAAFAVEIGDLRFAATLEA